LFGRKNKQNKLKNKNTTRIFKVHVLKENFGDDLSSEAVFPPTRKQTVSRLYPGSANRDEVALSLL